LDRLYFYGLIYGIGLFALISSIVLSFIYFVIGRYLDIVGCLMAFILSLFLLFKFTEGKAKRDLK